MKILPVILGIFLAVVAFLAFACAMVRRESEVGLLLADENFARMRTTCLVVGISALIADAVLVVRLWRRWFHAK